MAFASGQQARGSTLIGVVTHVCQLALTLAPLWLAVVIPATAAQARSMSVAAVQSRSARDTAAGRRSIATDGGEAEDRDSSALTGVDVPLHVGGRELNHLCHFRRCAFHSSVDPILLGRAPHTARPSVFA